MADIVIIDYGSGNVRSVARSLDVVSEKHSIVLSADRDKILNASHLVLPGVGAFEACYLSLTKTCKGETLEALCLGVLEQAKPFLGICVGHQLLAKKGLEFGSSIGLGWIDGVSAPLERVDGLVLPHMGWNSLNFVSPHYLFAPMVKKDVYFAHSFAISEIDEKYITATCNYGKDFCAAIACDNIIGTQFHPEKSQTVGLAFLKRFIEWKT